MEDELDPVRIAEELRKRVSSGASPSEAARALLAQYGLFSWAVLADSFYKSFRVDDSDFLATICVWEAYDSKQGISDAEFDRRMIPMIETTKHIWFT
jgi:hypothetical protein